MSIDTSREALNKVLGEEAKRLAGTPPPGLYHYTSSDGMRAIVDGGMLRAHNLGQMNDHAEARYGASIMRAHVDRAYAVEANAEAGALLQAMRRRMRTLNLENVFSLSFTSDGDEAGMWKLYADGGRGFSFAIPLASAVSWGGIGHRGILLKCSYGEGQVSAFCLKVLTAARDIFLREVDSGSNPDPEAYAAVFLEDASWFAPAFKPDAWRPEAEWRFIFVKSAPDHKHTPDGRRFVELPLRGAAGTTHPIMAICAGPDCDYDDDIVPLQGLLDARGFGANFPVHLSSSHRVRPGRRAPTVRGV